MTARPKTLARTLPKLDTKPELPRKTASSWANA